MTTVTIPLSVALVVADFIPKASVMNTETMQAVIAFLGEVTRVRDEAEDLSEAGQ